MAPHDARHAADQPAPVSGNNSFTQTAQHLSLAPPQAFRHHNEHPRSPTSPARRHPSPAWATPPTRGTSPATSALRIAGEAAGRRTNVIVVGVDASLGSADAVSWAADATERRHATLRLVHAYPFYAVPIQRPASTLAEEERAPDPESAPCWRTSPSPCWPPIRT